MSGRGGEAGYSLPEMLLAMAVMIVVLTATIAAFDGFGIATSANVSQNSAQSGIRNAIDRMARELRNTAGPGLSTPIERAQPRDFVFDTVDPFGTGSGANTRSVQRVRYCLDVGPDRKKLWRQVQNWTTASPPALSTASACPDASYGTQSIIVDYVVNDASGNNRPAFTYNSSTLANVTAVTVELYTDANLQRAPGEQALRTNIFLRNQNRAPTAQFTATVEGSKHVLLNASASSDPDEDNLSYQWYDGSNPIGAGATLDYTSPTTGNHSFSVTATDPGGLSSTAPAQTVNVT